MRAPRHQPPDQLRPLILQPTLDPQLPGVGPYAVFVVLGRRRRRPGVLRALIRKVPRPNPVGDVDVFSVHLDNLRVVALRGGRSAVRGSDAVRVPAGLLALELGGYAGEVGLDRGLSTLYHGERGADGGFVIFGFLPS